jgi:hypothetical protein
MVGRAQREDGERGAEREHDGGRGGRENPWPSALIGECVVVGEGEECLG